MKALLKKPFLAPPATLAKQDKRLSPGTQGRRLGKKKGGGGGRRRSGGGGEICFLKKKLNYGPTALWAAANREEEKLPRAERERVAWCEKSCLLPSNKKGEKRGFSLVKAALCVRLEREKAPPPLFLKVIDSKVTIER